MDDEVEKQPKRIFKVIMDYRIIEAHIFRTTFGFKQYDVILSKGQSVTTKIKSSFEIGNMQTQYNMLGYSTDLYFSDHKIARETNEHGHRDKNVDCEIKRQKAIE